MSAEVPAAEALSALHRGVAGASLQERLQAAARQQPQPEVHIRGDARADFEAVGRVVYACQTAGITRIGFITEPPAAGAR